MQLAFADCVLDIDRRELFRGAEPVPVGPKVFDLLVHLVQNRARVVSRDDLLDAIWDGRIVSESTLASHVNAVRRAIGDSGRDQRLIRTVARKGFRFIAEVVPASESGESAPTGPAAPALPERPSIAVLPFANLSGDPAQDYFADGVVEDIIAALSRLRWLFVIARNSSFTFKGRTVDARQAGRELGVRYLLEGSLRKAAGRVRITGQLIDATTGAHLWADRFEGVVDDIFALQDALTESVVGAIAPQLERAEIERARLKSTESLGAYDYYLRGRAKLNEGSEAAVGEGLALFSSAIALDPGFAPAHAMAAWCHFWRLVNGWTDDRDAETAKGARLARLAVDLGRDDAVALTRGGHALAHFTGDLDAGMARLERALLLDRNHAAAWFLGGYLRVWAGEPERAIEHFDHAMRLSPLDPELYRMQAGMAAAHLFAGRFDIAASWARTAARDRLDFLMAIGIAAASHALSGRSSEASAAMEQLRRLAPAMRLSTLDTWLPIRRSEHRAILAAGLGQAGLPK